MVPRPIRTAFSAISFRERCLYIYVRRAFLKGGKAVGSEGVTPSQTCAIGALCASPSRRPTGNPWRTASRWGDSMGAEVWPERDRPRGLSGPLQPRQELAQRGGALPRRPERQSADAPSGGAALLPGAAPTRTTPRRAHAPPLPLTQHRRRSTNIQLPTTSGHTTNHYIAMHDNEMTLRLARPSHLPEQLPHMAVGVLDPEQPSDHRSHTRAGPQVRGVPMGAWTLQEFLPRPIELLLQLRLARWPPCLCLSHEHYYEPNHRCPFLLAISFEKDSLSSLAGLRVALLR
jgi:hypothetical protein